MHSTRRAVSERNLQAPADPEAARWRPVAVLVGNLAKVRRTGNHGQSLTRVRMLQMPPGAYKATSSVRMPRPTRYVAPYSPKKRVEKKYSSAPIIGPSRRPIPPTMTIKMQIEDQLGSKPEEGVMRRCAMK